MRFTSSTWSTNDAKSWNYLFIEEFYFCELGPANLFFSCFKGAIVWEKDRNGIDLIVWIFMKVSNWLGTLMSVLVTGPLLALARAPFYRSNRETSRGTLYDQPKKLQKFFRDAASPLGFYAPLARALKRRRYGTIQNFVLVGAIAFIFCITLYWLTLGVPRGNIANSFWG